MTKDCYCGIGCDNCKECQCPRCECDCGVSQDFFEEEDFEIDDYNDENEKEW